MLFDYEVLRLIWWALLGILLIGFAVTDGFDMGAATLMPFIGKTDAERRVVINTVGPVWEGNQVWFILGGGAIFAAWPALYALSFSGFYLAMFFVLFALILRPVAFKYRSKRESKAWRRNWDRALFIAGAVPPVIFGVAVGNAMIGVPFHFMDDLRPIYGGNLFGLLNPAALFCGVLSLTMLLMHGAAWVTLKADGAVAARARRIGTIMAIASFVLFALGGVILALGGFGGYQLTGAADWAVDWAGPSFPLAKSVEAAGGAWLANYGQAPLLSLVPILAFAGMAGAAAGFRAGRERLTLLASGIGVAFIIASVGVSMFPFILPSSTTPDHSLMVFDASSSRATLRNMLIAVIIFLPIILGYTAWVFHVLRGKVTTEAVAASSHAY